MDELTTFPELVWGISQENVVFSPTKTKFPANFPWINRLTSFDICNSRVTPSTLHVRETFSMLPRIYSIVPWRCWKPYQHVETLKGGRERLTVSGYMVPPRDPPESIFWHMHVQSYTCTEAYTDAKTYYIIIFGIYTWALGSFWKAKVSLESQAFLRSDKFFLVDPRPPGNLGSWIH